MLVHGISAPLVPTYDLPVAGFSVIEELARRDYLVVAFDHRNFGGSDRDPAMARPPVERDDGAGLQTLDDSVADIGAVIDDAQRRFPGLATVLFGSSRGAIQALAYATTRSEALSLVILNNPSGLCYLAGADRERTPEVSVELAATLRRANYVVYTAEHQRERWRKVVGTSATVGAEVQDAYIQACIESDADAPDGQFRVPTESIPDRAPLLPLGRIAVPVLVAEAENVPASYRATFSASMPSGLLRILDIRDSDHFTLRNAKRFELMNVIDAATSAILWGGVVTKGRE